MLMREKQGMSSPIVKGALDMLCLHYKARPHPSSKSVTTMPCISLSRKMLGREEREGDGGHGGEARHGKSDMSPDDGNGRGDKASRCTHTTHIGARQTEKAFRPIDLTPSPQISIMTH
jgi:hypothetical protein